jgi:hypothetical protein
VNLDSVNTKTSTITVVPNLAYASTSTLEFVTPITLNIEETVTVFIYDEYSNSVIEEQPVLLSIEG